MSGIKGVEVSDLLGLSKPLTKLIEVVSAGAGNLYAPWHQNRMTKAKVEEIKLIGEAIQANISLPVEYSLGGVTINALNAQELMQRTGDRFVFQEVKKQLNIEAVLDVAHAELEKEQSVSDDPVDTDWAMRFFNSVGDISSETLQKLWGQILVGEIKKPQSYSLRTLDILKNITQAEAELFSKFAECILVSGSRYFVPQEGFNFSLLNKCGFNLETIISLEECGLISSEALTMSIKLPVGKQAYILGGDGSDILYKIGLLNEVNDPLTITVSGYFLTKSGSELFSIIHSKINAEFSDEYMLSLYVNNRNKDKFMITKHEIYTDDNGDVRYNINGSEISSS